MATRTERKEKPYGNLDVLQFPSNKNQPQKNPKHRGLSLPNCCLTSGWETAKIHVVPPISGRERLETWSRLYDSPFLYSGRRRRQTMESHFLKH